MSVIIPVEVFFIQVFFSDDVYLPGNKIFQLAPVSLDDGGDVSSEICFLLIPCVVPGSAAVIIAVLLVSSAMYFGSAVFTLWVAHLV